MPRSLFKAQGDNGADTRGAPRRYPASQQGNSEQQRGDSCVGNGVAGLDTVEKIRENTSASEGGSQADKQADSNDSDTLAENHF